MATWVRLGDVNDVPLGKGQPFETEVGEVAVFNIDGQFHAIDNECPHESAPLGRGRLSGTVVTCPGHGLRYDVTTGLNSGSDEGVRTYPLDLRDDGLYVDIDEPTGSADAVLALTDTELTSGTE